MKILDKSIKKKDSKYMINQTVCSIGEEDEYLPIAGATRSPVGKSSVCVRLFATTASWEVRGRP
jgi:hypothetical protein